MDEEAEQAYIDIRITFHPEEDGGCYAEIERLGGDAGSLTAAQITYATLNWWEYPRELVHELSETVEGFGK